MLGAIIGAGASLAGGLIAKKSQEKQAAQNIALQKEFAQSGIQWKVEDAKKAGVHPLYALGAQTTSFSPVSVGSDPLGQGIANAGQDISRAVNSTSTPTQRTSQFTAAMQSLALEKESLSNQLLRSQLHRMNQTPNPPLPSASQNWLVDGQGQTTLPDSSSKPLIQDDPLKRTAANPLATNQEPGAITDVGYARTATGLAPVPSKDAKDRIEDIMPAEWAWAWRNMVQPTWQQHSPPTAPTTKGMSWMYNPTAAEWQEVPTWMKLMYHLPPAALRAALRINSGRR